MKRLALALMLAALACRCVSAAGRDTMVGAYYYPWYNGPTFNGRGPAGGNTLIYHLDPQVKPELGWYNQRKDTEVVDRHYEWAKYAGIDFFVCSYWGKRSATDRTILERMLDNPKRGNVKLCVFWEPSITRGDGVTAGTIAAETDYLCDNYFDSPAYLRVDGRPVIFIYITRALETEALKGLIEAIRGAAKKKGKEIYIVGDEVWGKPNVARKTPRVKLMDAVTNYDVYGNLGRARFVTDAILDKWKSNNAGWKALADRLGRRMIPGIAPGYNDRAVRGEEDHPACSRKLNDEKHAFGSFFKGMIDRLDKDAEMVVITSWNEWHEDTQIEPTTVTDPTDADDRGGFYTQGVKYHGYGTLYLDILNRAFGSASDGPMSDIGMAIEHCGREARAIEQGSSLSTVLRSLDRAAKKDDDRGREATRFAEALRGWLARRNKELLEESRKAPARTLAMLKKHARFASGLPGLADIKAREQEIRKYKGVTDLVSCYKRHDLIRSVVADGGRSIATDRAMADLKKRLAKLAGMRGTSGELRAEIEAFMGEL